MTASHTERFAPSPTGRLHLGHAYSAILTHDRAKVANGDFLMRMEDLDTSRIRDVYYSYIEDDLAWLGLSWQRAVLRQSARQAAYDDALERLAAAGLTYACLCSRRDIAEAARAPQEGEPMLGPDGLVYPGTCREAGHSTDQPHALRLNIGAAIELLGGDKALTQISYVETGHTPGTYPLNAEDLRTGTGDIVLRRRDGAIAYHLAVVVDDAFQEVTHVTRGEDLAPAVPVQRLLQALLDLPEPIYHHHRLIRDAEGKRLAKRHDVLSLAALRDEGWQPNDIRARLGLRQR
ncbi:MAG: tRNA glutamyl-Q(34) synthetase GluQRS [Pseudomonadota bacterium]